MWRADAPKPPAAVAVWPSCLASPCPLPNAASINALDHVPGEEPFWSMDAPLTPRLPAGPQPPTQCRRPMCLPLTALDHVAGEDVAGLGVQHLGLAVKVPGTQAQGGGEGGGEKGE